MVEQRIWKYDTGLDGIDCSVYFDIPHGASVLSCANQGGRLCVWALVNPKRKPVRRMFRCVGTGHELQWDSRWDSPEERFVGTVLFHQGALVVHVFDVGEV